MAICSLDILLFLFGTSCCSVSRGKKGHFEYSISLMWTWGFPDSSGGKESCLQWGRPWFNSCVGKIRWRSSRLPTPVFLGFPCSSAGKESAWNVGDLGQSLGLEDPLEKRMATHSSVLAWRIPWTVYFIGWQSVGHNWATFTFSVNIPNANLQNTYMELTEPQR